MGLGVLDSGFWVMVGVSEFLMCLQLGLWGLLVVEVCLEQLLVVVETGFLKVLWVQYEESS